MKITIIRDSLIDKSKICQNGFPFVVIILALVLCLFIALNDTLYAQTYIGNDQTINISAMSLDGSGSTAVQILGNRNTLTIGIMDSTAGGVNNGIRVVHTARNPGPLESVGANEIIVKNRIDVKGGYAVLFEGISNIEHIAGLFDKPNVLTLEQGTSITSTGIMPSVSEDGIVANNNQPTIKNGNSESIHYTKTELRMVIEYTGDKETPGVLSVKYYYYRNGTVFPVYGYNWTANGVLFQGNASKDSEDLLEIPNIPLQYVKTDKSTGNVPGPPGAFAAPAVEEGDDTGEDTAPVADVNIFRPGYLVINGGMGSVIANGAAKGTNGWQRYGAPSGVAIETHGYLEVNGSEMSTRSTMDLAALYRSIGTDVIPGTLAGDDRLKIISNGVGILMELPREASPDDYSGVTYPGTTVVGSNVLKTNHTEIFAPTAIQIRYYGTSASAGDDTANDTANNTGTANAVGATTLISLKDTYINANTGIAFSGNTLQINIGTDSVIDAKDFGIKDESVSGTDNNLNIDGKVFAGTSNAAGIRPAGLLASFGNAAMSATDKTKLNAVYWVETGQYQLGDTPDEADKHQVNIETGDNILDNKEYWVDIAGKATRLSHYDNTTGKYIADIDPVTGQPYTVTLSFAPNSGSTSKTVPYITSAAASRSGYGVYITGSQGGNSGTPSGEAGTNADNNAADSGAAVGSAAVVGDLNVLGNDSLLSGGQAAIYIGRDAYVREITTGENSEVNSLFDSIRGNGNKRTQAENWQKVGNMTVGKRNEQFNRFNVSGIGGQITVLTTDAGVIGGGGDIVSYYAAYTAGTTENETPEDTGTDGAAATGTASALRNELFGHQSAASAEVEAAIEKIMADIERRDSKGMYPSSETIQSRIKSKITAIQSLRNEMIHQTAATDGTLLTFRDGDIYSGHIYGGGSGDYVDMVADYEKNKVTTALGNIDLRIENGTIVFNGGFSPQMHAELAGTNLTIDKDPETGNITRVTDDRILGQGINNGEGDFINHVRSLDISNGGSLLLNDAYFIVNRSVPNPNTTPAASAEGTPEAAADADTLIYDVRNGGIVSGNGSFEIGERIYTETLLSTGSTDDTDTPANVIEKIGYFGYFLNYGVLAPGLPGYAGTTLADAQFKIGGGIGEINIYGTPILYGEYQHTMSNQTLGEVLTFYNSSFDKVKNQLPEGMTAEEWKLLGDEKMHSIRSWFSAGGKKLIAPEVYAQEKAAAESAYEADKKNVLVKNPELRLPADPTQLDALLFRMTYADLLNIHGNVITNAETTAEEDNTAGGTETVENPMRLGGVLRIDQLFNTGISPAQHARLTTAILAVSDGTNAFDPNTHFTSVESDTNRYVFVNVSQMPVWQEEGRSAAMVTAVDNEHYYRDRVSSHNARQVAKTLDNAMFTNPGLAASMGFGLNETNVLENTLRQLAAPVRADSVLMNLWSPSDNVFNRIGYGHGGLSTGNRGNVVFRNAQTGQMTQPYGQPAVAPPGYQFGAPQNIAQRSTIRGQEPCAGAGTYRTGNVWATYLHSSFRHEDDGNTFGFTYDRNGGMVGMEWNLTPSCVWGYTAAVADGTMREYSSKVQSTDYNLGLYFVAAPYEQFELKSFFGTGFQDYHFKRRLHNGAVYVANDKGVTADNIFGLSEFHNSDTSGYSFNYSLELARPFTVSPNFVIRPVTGFEIQVLTQNAFREPGTADTWSNSGENIANGMIGETSGKKSGNYGLNYDGIHFSRSLAKIGFNTESYLANYGWQSRAYLVRRLTGGKYVESTASFQSGSQRFTTWGTNMGNSYLQLGLGGHRWLDRGRTATIFGDIDTNLSFGHGGYGLLNFSAGFMQNF